MSDCIILSGGTWSPDYFSKIKRPLGPYRLSSALEDAGYSTFVLEFSNEFTIEETLKLLSKHLDNNTLWLGFSSTFYWPKNNSSTGTTTTNDHLREKYYTEKYEDVRSLIDFVRKNSKAKILYGGSKSPYYCYLDDDKNIDYYVIGNADNSIIDITDYLSGKKNKIEHLENNIVDSRKYPEPKMDNISTKWWKKEYNILPNEGVPIELARGCIFKCKFCDYPLTGKKKGTYLRSTSEIKDELIRMWEVQGIDSYYFTDDTFNDDNEKLEALHKVFIDLPFKPKFSAYLRVDLLNKHTHQADLLNEMGLVGTFLGLETMQPESARAIGKGLHPNKVKDRLYWLHDKWKNKVNIEAGFILGLPYDRISYFNELISWALEEDNPLQAVRFYPLMLFNYNQVEKRIVEFGSEFSINPEIYGYEFEDISSWVLPQQKLSHRLCNEIANNLNTLRHPLNKISGFQVITALNTGIKLEDIYSLTETEISKKYNMIELNQKRFNEYKTMVGI
jgi:radical SAM superfamily enzyme